MADHDDAARPPKIPHGDAQEAPGDIPDLEGDELGELNRRLDELLDPDARYRRPDPRPAPELAKDATWFERVEAGAEPSALGRAFGSLSDDERFALALAVWDGRDPSFVGDVLGIAPANADHLIRTAVSRLRTRFAKFDVDGSERGVTPGQAVYGADGVNALELLAEHDPNPQLGPLHDAAYWSAEARRFQDRIMDAPLGAIDPVRPDVSVAAEATTRPVPSSGYGPSRGPTQSGGRRRRRPGARLAGTWATLSRRARVALAGALAVVVLGSATAAAVVLTRTPTVTTTISCYGSFSLHPERREAVPPAAGGPIAVCQPVWTHGTFAVPGQPPPPLKACVLPGGALGVFPDPQGDPCSTLGLAAPTNTPTPHDTGVQQVFNDLRNRFSASCISPTDGGQQAREDLARAGLQGWTVHVRAPRGPSYVCSSFALDQPSRTIDIVPIPRTYINGPGS